MRTLIFLKPDGVRKCLMSELIRLNIRNSLRLVAYQLVQQPVEFWFEFYSVHANNPAFPDFRGFAGWLSSMPLPFQVVESSGDDTVVLVRRLVVATLREKYQANERETCLHASDSDAAAAREIPLVFPSLRV